eukprot:513495-Pleurochrysis_carterae.AAC.1
MLRARCDKQPPQPLCQWMRGVPIEHGGVAAARRAPAQDACAHREMDASVIAVHARPRSRPVLEAALNARACSQR